MPTSKHSDYPHSYAEAKEILDKARVSGYRVLPGVETHLVRTSPDSISLTYHNTAVVRWYAASTIIRINTGGWMTATTKLRLNDALPIEWRVYQEKKVWYICNSWYQNQGWNEWEPIEDTWRWLSPCLQVYVDIAEHIAYDRYGVELAVDGTSIQGGFRCPNFPE